MGASNTSTLGLAFQVLNRVSHWDLESSVIQRG